PDQARSAPPAEALPPGGRINGGVVIGATPPRTPEYRKICVTSRLPAIGTSVVRYYSHSFHSGLRRPASAGHGTSVDTAVHRRDLRKFRCGGGCHSSRTLCSGAVWRGAP